MTNIFSKKTAAPDKVEDDFLGGGGVLDTNIYEATIKTAYIGKASASDARNVTLLLDINGKEIHSTIWVTNRSGDVTYVDKKTKEKKNLPGFNQINSLCMLIAGKEMGQMDVEELTVKIYDYDAKKELPQAVDCFTELHGEKVIIALQRQTVDKTAKNTSTGVYEPTGETRDQNEIIKFFAPDCTATISEVSEFIKSLGGNFDEILADGDLLKAVNKMTESDDSYAAKWLEKNKGQTYNKAKGGKSESNNLKEFSDKPKKKSSLFDD